MNKTAECPLCREANYKLCKQGVRHAEDVDVHECLGCGLVYLWPQPSDERLAAFYTNEYRNVYDDPTPAERHGTDMPEASQRVDRLKPILSQRARVLEIGSGSCAFLKSISAHVGEVVGVEPDQATRAWFSTVSAIHVYHDLDEVPVAGGFDFIVLFHVLEHLSDPVSFLKQLEGRLNVGGRIVVEVPNVDDALMSLYGVEAFTEFYFSIAHLTYFSPKTLHRCACEAGLIGEVTGVQRYDLSNHIHWALSNAPGGQEMYSAVIKDDTNQSYARDLAANGKSDTLWGEFLRVT